MSEYNMSHTGQELDDAINKVQSGYILPSGTLNIASNGTKDVKNYASVNVNVPVPSGYIKIAGTKLYVTQFASGQYTPSADTLLSNVSISNVGFKPKIFMLFNNSGIIITSTSTSKYWLTSSFMVTDSNYNVLQKATTFLNYNTGNKIMAGGHSEATSNTFSPASNGVKGGSGTTIYALGAREYIWYAWG